MSPELPIPNAASQGPSTKTWLLMLSLLTMLLLTGSRLQLPTHGAMPPVLTSSPARGATLPSGGRVALQSPSPTALATAIAL